MKNQEIYKIKLDGIHQRFMSLRLYMKSHEMDFEDFQNELVEINHIINDIIIQCAKENEDNEFNFWNLL